jgi:hypothetical protein
MFRTERAARQLPPGSALPFMAVILGTIALASCAATAAVHAQDAAGALATLRATLSAALASLGPGESPVGAAKPLLELGYTSLLSTDLVLLIELVALQSVSSTEAALVYSLEPVRGTGGGASKRRVGAVWRAARTPRGAGEHTAAGVSCACAHTCPHALPGTCCARACACPPARLARRCVALRWPGGSWASALGRWACAAAGSSWPPAWRARWAARLTNSRRGAAATAALQQQQARRARRLLLWRPPAGTHRSSVPAGSERRLGCRQPEQQGMGTSEK